MTTFADVPDFPTIEDFYAFLSGQGGNVNAHGFFQFEFRVWIALIQHLEQLGLNACQ